ncbi:hypothetical protein ZWY2020_029305 [Hordeum vulgare]|nr:hypothetical protein ZWY2020_029305 [Hordeum vulgare]
MTTPNYHPTLPKVAPRSEKPMEPSSLKPAWANPEMKEKGTLEKPAKQKMKENGNGAGRHRENPPTWYYEKFRVQQLDSSISYELRLRLLIQNWSEEKAKKVDNIIQNNYLGVEEYVEDLLTPFIPARDGTLAKPKTSAQDEAFGRAAVKIKQDLSAVHKLFKEVDDIHGAPSLDDESFRKQLE